MDTDTVGALSRLVSSMARAETVESVMHEATQLAIELLGADHASIRLCEPDSTLRSVARAGAGVHLPPSEFRTGQGVLGWAVETGQTVNVPDCQSDDRFVTRQDRGFAVRSVMSIPLRAGARVLGVFSVSAARPNAFDALAEHMAAIIAHYVAQAQRTAELERLATTDALTHTLSRSQLGPRLESEMNRAKRTGKPLTMALLDLDHFKRVNDAYGHGVGDAVLVAFADTVRGCVRNFDLLVRRGGEEFALIMPAAGLQQGWSVAERIRSQLEREPIRVDPSGEKIAIHQTVSIGLATWDGSESVASLDRRADLAMYEAKASGRNRIRGSGLKGDPSRQGTLQTPAITAP